ncbi:sensor histidine kinase [Aridibaculum aurantiacum]|uniref:sensor histidine kinase n=1 Tax=Aridibaculum aurantiacum TaxID=2810307 RepID=UPI001A9762CC|nr:sensor histidine kinase [Aridibaculum aurantiacum]
MFNAKPLAVLLLVVLFMSCKSGQQLPANLKDSFFIYLDKGDEAYAGKTGFKNFETSLEYYDKARAIADETDDTLLLAEAIFAKGRVFDAWNRDPQNTISHFSQAAALFATMPQVHRRYLYVKHLLAHAYDKMGDSINCVSVLRELYHEIQPLPDSLRSKLGFTSEMALVSTEVRNYPLADSILNNLTSRAWIVNDSNTYNYLDHYYLAQSRLDVHYRRHIPSPHVDSLRKVVDNAATLDKMYYALNLSQLYAGAGRYDSAFSMLQMHNQLANQVNNNADITSMEEALLRSELQAEKRKTEYKSTLRRTWVTAIWILSILLGFITVLSLHLQRQKKRYKVQTRKLAATNHVLDEKIEQVQVMNKEIQHRVKNNLHMVFSLLQMQERKTTHRETTNNLQAAMLRIEAIASLNNELVETSQNPDLAKHIKHLMSSAINCLSNDGKIVTQISVEVNQMPLKWYLPVSLIINEWVTNSLKYCQPKTDLVELNIAICKKEDGITVTYNDNGEIQPKQPEGLGSQIIHMLCRQISAKIETLHNNPYHYQLTLNYD